MVSHFNKATKGRLTRALLEDGRTPRRPAALADLLRDLGWKVEVGEPTKAGHPPRRRRRRRLTPSRQKHSPGCRARSPGWEYFCLLGASLGVLLPARRVAGEYFCLLGVYQAGGPPKVLASGGWAL